MSGLVSAVRIDTEPLGGSPLSRLAQGGEPGDGWFAPRPRTGREWRLHAERVQSSAPPGWHEALAPALGSSSGASAERLARAVSGRGVVVTTGQQPGLFGGPVYTWSKAVSALALADCVEAATGIPAAPVFWAATDDSDFAEASWTMLGRPGGADRVAIAPTAPEGTRLADVPLPDMSDLLARLAESCGSVADPRPLEAVRRAYVPGASVGGAYLTLLRELLEPLGITVLDSSHPAVSAAAHPLLLRALLEREGVARALESRGSSLNGAGFAPQVTEMPDLTLVFQRSGARRVRVARAHAAVTAAAAEAGALSPNVLLRPVMERFLLPTVAYVAGPGELAYFAQVSAVAGALGVAAPLAVPRWSGTLIEPDVGTILSRYQLSGADFVEPDQVETRLARAAWPSGVSASLDALRRGLAGHVSGVRAALADAGGLIPAATVDGMARAMEWRLGRLERRVTAAVKRREAALMRELGRVRGALYPGGLRQERALNLVPLLARHGLGLLEAMRDQASRHAEAMVAAAAEPATAP